MQKTYMNIKIKYYKNTIRYPYNGIQKHINNIDILKNF